MKRAQSPRPSGGTDDCSGMGETSPNMEMQVVGHRFVPEMEKLEEGHAGAKRPTEMPKASDGVHGLSMVAYGALLALTVQNCGAVLIMRYTLAMPQERNYSTQTAVIMQETLKVAVCSALMLLGGAEYGTMRGCFQDHVELMKSGVPALLYLVQNNLQYLAIGSLQPATYQVTYQLKILSTALLSVLLLGKQLTRRRWGSLVVLTAGVACVNLSEMSSSKNADSETLNLSFGLICTLASTLSSGLAGVYFEKILKDGSKLTLWQRNVQLGLYSVVIGFGGLVSTGSWPSVAEKGFFHGYTPVTAVSICIQALGGLVIAVVIKHADNILKNFATGMSVVISCCISAFIFDFNVTALFVSGAALVNVAIFLYS